MFIDFKINESIIPEELISLTGIEGISVDFNCTSSSIHIRKAIYNSSSNDAMNRTIEIVQELLLITTKERFQTIRNNKKENSKIKIDLNSIDKDSIRYIRDYIARKPDAPQELKDLETNAVSKREELKPER